jgi:hypothetical protein
MAQPLKGHEALRVSPKLLSAVAPAEAIDVVLEVPALLPLKSKVENKLSIKCQRTAQRSFHSNGQASPAPGSSKPFSHRQANVSPVVPTEVRRLREPARTRQVLLPALQATALRTPAISSAKTKTVGVRSVARAGDPTTACCVRAAVHLGKV